MKIKTKKKLIKSLIIKHKANLKNQMYKSRKFTLLANKILKLNKTKHKNLQLVNFKHILKLKKLHKMLFKNSKKLNQARKKRKERKSQISNWSKKKGISLSIIKKAKMAISKNKKRLPNLILLWKWDSSEREWR